MSHADTQDAAVMLSNHVITKADAELIGDLDRGLRQARSIIDALMADPRARRALMRTEHWDALENFSEDEGNQTELCWLWETDEA